MRFEFATAARIVFGPGTLAEAGPAAAAMGRRALVVTGAHPDRAAPLSAILQQHGLDVTTFAVPGEPTLTLVRQGVETARSCEIDIIIGFGGGSALDTAKAIAALSTNAGDVLDYVEVIGAGKALQAPALPLIAIPTTAGTGSEVTRNAVLSSPEHGVKVSLRSAFLLPRLAIVDPQLTYTLPPAVTAATGLDALTQLIEAFVSRRANALTDALCREGIRMAARALPRAYACGDDTAAREEMALASLLSGMALANAGLGAVHGLAAAIGGAFPAPHGAVCARLLPWVMEANIRALRARGPAETLQRYEEIARLVTGSPQATAEAGAGWARDLVESMSIPPLSAYGIGPRDLGRLAEKAGASSSMRGNPVALSREEMRGLLGKALGKNTP